MCWFKSNSKKELGIFFSSRRQAEPGAERAPSPFLICAKRRPCLWLGVLFRSLFAGKARHCGAVKNFFQPLQNQIEQYSHQILSLYNLHEYAILQIHILLSIFFIYNMTLCKFRDILNDKNGE